MKRVVVLLILLALLFVFQSAHAQVSAWLCDYWPIAVGNSWFSPAPCCDFYSDLLKVTDQFVVGQVPVYEVLWEVAGGFAGTTEDHTFYVFFLDGWLYGCDTKAALDGLPETTSEMTPLLPEVLTEGQEFTAAVSIEIGSINSASATVVLNGLSFVLKRGLGPTDIAFDSGTQTEAHIVGGCGGIFDAKVSGPDSWVKAGSPVSLTAAGDFGTEGYNFQWRKDGADIPGATDRTYALSSASEEDTGVYACVIGVNGKSSHEAAPLVLRVFANLPVARGAGLLTVLFVAAAFSCLKRRHRASSRNRVS